MSNENKILSEDEGSTEPVPHPTPDTHTNPSESAYEGTGSYSTLLGFDIIQIT